MGWQRRRGTNWSEIEAYLQLGGNAGLLLVNGWTDIDLDCPEEAIMLASDFLPTTDCTFGRVERAALALDLPVGDPAATYRKFVEPMERPRMKLGETLVELRAAAAEKAIQTVVPGSTHPSGERSGR